MVKGSNVGMWILTYVACSLVGGTAIVLWGSVGAAVQATWSQLAFVFFVVGPLAGIPLVLLAAAIREKSFVGVVGGVVLLIFGAYWGFGVGR